MSSVEIKIEKAFLFKNELEKRCYPIKWYGVHFQATETFECSEMKEKFHNYIRSLESDIQKLTPIDPRHQDYWAMIFQLKNKG